METTDRLIITIDGNLVFAYVTEEDGGTYRPTLCVRTNNGSLNVTGQTIRLSVRSANCKSFLSFVYFRK